MKAVRWFALVVVAALVGGCGSGDGEGGALSASPTADETAFCQKILPVVWSGDQAKFNEVTKDPPAGFNPKDDKNVVAWVEGHCYPDIARDAAPENQRIATTRNTKLDGLVACVAATPPPAVETPPIVIYGKGEDPYDGEMLGVVSGGSSHVGDGQATPVTVRGVVGNASSITVFQQIVLKRLGTVISWEENGKNYGLYGRLFDKARVPELVALADRLELVDGRMQLPDAAQPAGFRQVYSGQAVSVPLINPFSGSYTVEYREPAGGLVNLVGREMTDEEFDAFRIFTLDMREEKIGDRNAIVGYPWDRDGFALVQFRDESGLVVRLFSTRLRLERLIEITKKTRSLSRAEWTELATIPSTCDGLN